MLKSAVLCGVLALAVAACGGGASSGPAALPTVPTATPQPSPVATFAPGTAAEVLTDAAGDAVAAPLPSAGGYGGTFELQMPASGKLPANLRAVLTTAAVAPPNAPAPAFGSALVYVWFAPAATLTLQAFPNVTFTTPGGAQSVRRAQAAALPDTLDFYDPGAIDGGYTVAGTCTAAPSIACSGASTLRTLFADATYTFALVEPPAPPPPSAIALTQTSAQLNVPGSSIAIGASETGAGIFSATSSAPQVASVALAPGSTSSFVVTAGYSAGFAIITVSDSNGVTAQAQIVVSFAIGNIS